MSTWHIAQMNVGTIRYPIDDPRMHGFTSRLDEINAIADEASGFVWRLQSGSGNATDIIMTEDPLFIVNMSVWENVEALRHYVYESLHRDLMSDRRMWFEKAAAPYQVLWWVKAGTIPTAEDGLARLDALKTNGPTERAFGFKDVFPSPDIQTS